MNYSFYTGILIGQKNYELDLINWLVYYIWISCAYPINVRTSSEIHQKKKIGFKRRKGRGFKPILSFTQVKLNPIYIYQAPILFLWNSNFFVFSGNSELEPRRCVDEGVLLCICETCRSRRCQTMPNRATGRSPSQG